MNEIESVIETLLVQVKVLPLSVVPEAVIVEEPIALGAVKLPLEVIVPELDVNASEEGQVTEEPLLVHDAEYAEVAPISTELEPVMPQVICWTGVTAFVQLTDLPDGLVPDEVRVTLEVEDGLNVVEVPLERLVAPAVQLIDGQAEAETPWLQATE